jgi:hypothetical protein
MKTNPTIRKPKETCFLFVTDAEEYQRSRDKAAKVRIGKEAREKRSLNSRNVLRGLNDGLKAT